MSDTNESSLGVAVVHLISGEDIVGVVTQQRTEFGTMVVITNPIVPQIARGADGRPTIGLMPLRPYAVCEEVAIPSDKVMWVLPAISDLEAAYNQMFSKVQLASAADLNALPALPIKL